MTFGEVENLVGGLPDSARRHRAWWSNSSHVARAWQDAGWHLHSVNQVTEQVLFVRATDSGRPRARTDSPNARGPYIDVRVIVAITARHAQDQFDCAKLQPPRHYARPTAAYHAAICDLTRSAGLAACPADRDDHQPDHGLRPGQAAD